MWLKVVTSKTRSDVYRFHTVFVATAGQSESGGKSFLLYYAKVRLTVHWNLASKGPNERDDNDLAPIPVVRAVRPPSQL
jgi:hypothetical protein